VATTRLGSCLATASGPLTLRGLTEDVVGVAEEGAGVWEVLPGEEVACAKVTAAHTKPESSRLLFIKNADSLPL